MTQKNFNAKKMLMSTTASTSINIQEEQQKEQKTDIFTSILNFFMRAK